MMNLRRLSFSLLVTATLMAGCSAPSKPPQVVDATGSTQAASVDMLLSQAERERPIRSAELKLQAAQLLVQQGERNRVERILATIDTNILTPTLAFEVAKLRAGDSMEQQRAAEALRYLDRQRFSALPAPQQAELSQLRADAWLAQDDRVAASRELIMSSLLVEDDTERQRYHDQIWQLLQAVPDSSLRQAIQSGNSYHEQGWFELAEMVRASSDLPSREAALERWRQLWQAHPVMILPPTGLMGLQQGGEMIQARRIAVVLPLTGELAQPANAILDGIRAAQSVQSRQGQVPAQLSLIDSSLYSNADDIVQAARQQGAEMIIGPLDQGLVTQFSNQPEREWPVLALNPAPNGPSTPWQLELSSEHEARMVAKRALAEGQRNVLLITPAAEWGDRVQAVMREELSAGGGRVVGTLRYQAGGSYDEQIARLMLTDQSKQREQQLRQLLRHRLEFQERSRQDADAILLTALPDAARLIKSMLNYHYAADLPVYATSHLYPGYPDASRDLDLNNITFCDLPWILEPPSEAHRALSAEGKDTLSRFGRLYALGVDAINLYPWLEQLQSAPGAFLQAETGMLSIDANRRVQRVLSCTRFVDGVPAPVPSNRP